MLESFYAFNVNAISNFLYMLQANSWFFLMIIGVLGIIVLSLKEQIDTSVKDTPNII